jgi:transposase
MLRTGRDASILRLSAQDGMSIDRLAEMFGLSRRTIFRVLRSGRGSGEGPMGRGL